MVHPPYRDTKQHLKIRCFTLPLATSGIGAAKFVLSGSEGKNGIPLIEYRIFLHFTSTDSLHSWSFK